MKFFYILILPALFMTACKQKSVDESKTPQNSIQLELGHFTCSPTHHHPKILSAPDTMSVHTEWKLHQIDTTWSFTSRKKITNEKGVFLQGDLIGPNGEKATNGPFYILFPEWNCR